MEINEQNEVLPKRIQSKNHRKFLNYNMRSDILKQKRKRNQSDMNYYFENSEKNDNSFINCQDDFNYNFENDIFCEYDHSIKSLSTNEESFSIKNENKNQIISQLKKDLCPYF